MPNKSLGYICLVFALLVSILVPGATPALAAKPDTGFATLQLLNRAMGRVTVELSGPHSYTFYIDPNVKTDVQVLKGKYEYRYEACGTLVKGKITVPQVKKFKTIKCTMAKVTVFNYTGHPFQLQLFGPADYRLTIQPGTNKITVLKGKYTFIAITQFCGGGKTKGGRYQLTNGVRWPWWCGPG